MRQGFIIDLNKCTGCHACVLACQIENAETQEIAWREVFPYSNERLAGIPALQYSVACNHCEEAPCKPACPAEAFSRDKATGAIIHHEEACIGCKYCTWACPFEAPKYNEDKGVVEKCTFCLSRLEGGKKPACTTMCPTGALGYGPVEKEQQAAPGFIQHPVQPALNVIPPRREKGPEVHIHQEYPVSLKKTSAKRISFRHEWPLAVFSFITAILFGIVAGELAGKRLAPWWIFPSLGLAGLVLSTAHLGRRDRAWRSIIHFKDSWLSREIIFFGLFLIAGSWYLGVWRWNLMGIIAIVTGVFTLFSIDRVYDPVRQKANRYFHSADTVLTGALFAALLMERPMLIILMLLIKLIFFIFRKSISRHAGKPIGISGISRLLIGIVAPIILIYLGFDSFFPALFFLLLVGEAIDRIAFYNDLEVKKPVGPSSPR
jgi:Fe-S-cluster-containing dehydrogenase component/DMSO reductase anchor subunit